MLLLAKQWLARLPFRNADLLIVDEIGKDISGSGMDTNIIGRKVRLSDRAAARRSALHEARLRARIIGADARERGRDRECRLYHHPPRPGHELIAQP